MLSARDGARKRNKSPVAAESQNWSNQDPWEEHCPWLSPRAPPELLPPRASKLLRPSRTRVYRLASSSSPSIVLQAASASAKAVNGEPGTLTAALLE
jgi:hypothetical protein